ncbi:conserved hypothetical protein, partial [Trichinella spiralis]|uniref:hypothetical protein n=1 Tax=Trichinella spiralis TaxID=6334 RepID=UPI0001EFEBDB
MQFPFVFHLFDFDFFDSFLVYSFPCCRQHKLHWSFCRCGQRVDYVIIIKRIRSSYRWRSALVEGSVMAISYRPSVVSLIR